MWRSRRWQIKGSLREPLTPMRATGLGYKSMTKEMSAVGIPSLIRASFKKGHSKGSNVFSASNRVTKAGVWQEILLTTAKRCG